MGGSKEKICPTYFEIGQTYLKIQGTYFSASENPMKTCRKKADKYRHGILLLGNSVLFACVVNCLNVL